ncbi:hypothetical protein AYI70_g7467 [Smittium culicis]|uniref:Uncharacterized protein n=1 Tax=Smittium culicis TaxID=133412 RepID=A0A1R1XKK5_9FUNG|nr:hypothetical protein AYI70_g7467 [Smittium culicis]
MLDNELAVENFAREWTRDTASELVCLADFLDGRFGTDNAPPIYAPWMHCVDICRRDGCAPILSATGGYYIRFAAAWYVIWALDSDLKFRPDEIKHVVVAHCHGLALAEQLTVDANAVAANNKQVRRIEQMRLRKCAKF